VSFTDDLPRPRPARIPDRVLGQREPRRRVECPRGRLTRTVIADVAALVASGTPLGIVADAVGVSTSTFRDWRRRADDALKKRATDRTQLERLCIELQESIRLAQGQAGVRTHLAIADPAGITGVRRTRTVTTTRKVAGEDGEMRVVEQVEREEEIPADWRAAAHLGRYRFRDEMGAEPAPDPDLPAGPLVSADQLFARLAQIRAERALAGGQAAITVGGEGDE
jgi:hypothetical protein